MAVTKRKLLEKMLSLMARAVLRKHRPFIVGITGSVGKSSTKEAIALVLSGSYNVRKSEGNYNNEIGIPLTIIGAKSGGGSLVGWVGVCFRWLWVMVFPSRYPEMLVLEMGIDRPGDMERLMRFVPLQIAVVTNIGASHLEFFGSIANIAKEKSRIVCGLPEGGFAVLNADDKRVLKMREKTDAKTITYGFDGDAQMRADNLLFHRDAKRVEGFSFKLNYDGKSIPVRLPKIVAKYHIGSVLAAAAVGVALKMNLVEIAGALEAFEPLPGRLRLLPGRNAMILLDDTYNASPASTEAALSVVQELIAPRKVVILGDMLELGVDTEETHRKLADRVVASGAHVAILAGQHMRALYDELLARGFSRKYVLWLPDPLSARQIILDTVRPEDLILIKGSQGMRMEKITEILLAEPKDRAVLLCRQTPSWQQKAFIPPVEWSAI